MFKSIFNDALFNLGTIWLTLQSFSLVLSDDKFPLVKIPSGGIQGVYLKTPLGNTFEAYLGVRYAQPPFGDLRFKEAQPVKPWIGNYNASTYGSDCLQFGHFGYQLRGSEDCLFINIYKPAGQSKEDGSLFEVLVHMHGGAFMFFTPQGFKPNKLMDNDIVYVSINYRLGPLGFTSTGDRVLPGNLGLKDQVFALKWVRDNIQYFGGDANKITLTGISAGGVSTHLHLLSPRSRGLFQRGLSGSGAALNPWALTENVPEKTKMLARNLGCPTDDSAKMVKCLSERPAAQIVQQVPVFLGWLYNPFSPFGPVIEPEDADSPFLSRHPYDILKSGDFAQVPWICGFTTEEGLYPAAEFVDNPQLLNQLEDNWLEFAPYLLDYNFTVPCKEKRDQITNQIAEYYFKGKTVTESVKELIQLIGDRIFGAGIVQSAMMQAAVSKAPVYMYRFGYRGAVSGSEFISQSNTNFGVCHGDDGGYVYEGEIYGTMDQTKEDRRMGERMRHLYISFIKTGVPEFFKGKSLPTVKEALPKIRYLEVISPDTAVPETKSDLAEMNFWASLPFDERTKLPDHLKDEL